MELCWVVLWWIIYISTFALAWTSCISLTGFWWIFHRTRESQSSKACKISSLIAIDVALLWWIVINTVSRKIKLTVDATKTSNADEAQFRLEIEIGWHFHAASISLFAWAIVKSIIVATWSEEIFFLYALFSYFMWIGKNIFHAACLEVDEKWFFFLCSVHAKCIWWNSWKWPERFLWRFTTRVINCNFLSLGRARCHFSDAHSII